MAANPYTQAHGGLITPLLADDRFEASSHRWSQNELDALALAHAARRPLLVRGEPGSGKSQLARAAAALTGAGTPLVQVIHPRFEPRDLLYRYDTLQRLSDANTPGRSLEGKTYVRPGKLWEAWTRAAESQPVVVLLDEIDKGEADVPNSLLEILGQRRFQVDEEPDKPTPELPREAMPLIIITTNEERELPAAFVRRCVVLNLNPPKDEEKLCEWLRERVQAHASAMPLMTPDIVELTLAQVLADRRDAERLGYPKVGLAEALDLLTALHEITRDIESAADRKAAQETWLNKISAYALVKHAGTDPGQSRPVASAADGGES